MSIAPAPLRPPEGPLPAAARPSPLPALAVVPPFVLATRALAVASLLALIGWGLAWELWLAPTGQRTLSIKVLPLVIPLAGLLKLRLYTYRWVSLLVWLYVIEGIVRGSGPGPARVAWLGWGQVLLCVLLFVACTAHVRFRLKHKTLDS